MSATARLAGQTAIVTAAGQGLGEAISILLAREGAAVAVTDIDFKQAGRVAEVIQAAGGAAMAIKVDATNRSEVAAMVKAVLDWRATVDILVNVAGGFHRFAPITEIQEEEWDKVITVNLKSTFLCSQAVAKVMMQKKKGRIINIASLGGLGPNPYAPSYIPYGTAKAGVIGFTRHLAKDLGPFGITVNAVSPGTTLTPRVRAVRDEASIAKLAEQNPMRRLVETEDTAEAVVYLASEAARNVTGHNLNVNAGTMMA